MTDELKPCPLCGSTSVYLQPVDPDDDDLSYDTEGWRVMCYACTCRVGYKKSIDNAITAWNNRVEPIGNPDEIPEWMRNKIESEINSLQNWVNDTMYPDNQYAGNLAIEKLQDVLLLKRGDV